MISLKPGEIHLWLTHTDGCIDEPLCSAYRSLLTDEEQHQETKFYFERDRKQYLVTRALVRVVLSQYAPISPKDWIFKNNTFGRPLIANTSIECLRLMFNISHTTGLIVLAVTVNREVGVDTEIVGIGDHALDIANQFLALNESQALFALPLKQQPERLLEYWTLKESYIKARGMGLSVPLDQFSFHFFDNDNIEFTTQPELADDSSRWQFWQFRPTPNHLVAVCAARLNQLPSKLVARTLVPLTTAEGLEIKFLRYSKTPPPEHFG